jgi:protein-tyrosine phosphatase
MSMEPKRPSSVEEQQQRSAAPVSVPETGEVIPPPPVEQPIQQITQPPPIQFSTLRWASMGVVRVLYRLWTRIAAHLFPEDSKTEKMAQTLHIPLPDRLNLSWINDHLAVGGRVRPEDIRALRMVGITHIVDTRAEYCDDREALAKEHIELLHLPTRDTYPISIEQMMQASSWVQQRIEQGGRVLIHCEHGVGRSVLLTCAVLVYGGMHANDALTLVQEKRWQASPNQRQIERLKEFEAACGARRNT